MIERIWFPLTGDKRFGFCTSDNCGGQPAWRMEADGIGSNYCSGCRAKIDGDRAWRRYGEDCWACERCGAWTAPGVLTCAACENLSAVQHA